MDKISGGEIELLIDGLTDDVAFVWALVDLGLRRNDGTDEAPSASTVDEAFLLFRRLLDRDLIRIGKVVYVDPDQPRGTVAPVTHVSEPIELVHQRVLDACAKAESDGVDWEWSCWTVNTEAGNDMARQVLDQAERRQSDAFREWLQARNNLRRFNFETLPGLTRDVDELDEAVGGVAQLLQRRDDDHEIVWPVDDVLARIDRLTTRLETLAPATDDESRSQTALVEWIKVMRIVYAEALARRTK